MIRWFARNGIARVRVIAKERTVPRDLLDEVKSRIDRINSFPPEIEPPVINIPDSSQWFDVIKVVVAGDMDEADLLRIRTPSGGEEPFHSVATATFSRARSDITRIDGAQVVSISAKPEDESGMWWRSPKTSPRGWMPCSTATRNCRGDTPDTSRNTSRPANARSSAASPCFWSSTPCWPFSSARSLQAQFLIPMAASLAFGILFATAITLYLIPSSYLVAEDIRGHLGRFRNWYFKPFRPEGASK